MTTKTKISKSLKNELKNELSDQQEKARLKRIKENSKLAEITIFSSPNDKAYLDLLKSEGIKYKNIDVSTNPIEWKKTTSITNLGFSPTIIINDVFHLVRERDFQNPQQLLKGIKYLSDPRNQTPVDSIKILEHAKTNNYYLFQRINHLENALKPMTQFIQNLEKQLKEEGE